MNKELLNAMKARRDEISTLFNRTREEYLNLSDKESSKADRLYNNGLELKELYNEVVADIKNYQESYEADSRATFNYFEKELIDKYGVKAEDKTEVIRIRESKNNNAGKTIAAILAGATLLTGAFHLGKFAKENNNNNNNNNNSEVVEVVELPTAESKTISPSVSSMITISEVPFEGYGSFTNVNNEAQLNERATKYYNTYVKDRQLMSQISVEDIKNDMRMMNSNFMLDSNGRQTYNETYLDSTASDLHTIANNNSYVQYGNQLFFTPMAPLFEDGSLAQKSALQFDAAMKKVVDAIRKGDDCAFVEAARNWGTILLNSYLYVDFTGEYVNVPYQVAAPQAYYCYHAARAFYASTILEYSEGHHLNVCIPFCTDYKTNELSYKALSELIYDLEQRAFDAVAVRSGNQEHFAANNVSLVKRLYNDANTYFTSKYQLEKSLTR